MESRPSPSSYDKHLKLLICGAGKAGKTTVLQGFSTHIDNNGGWRTFIFDNEKILIEVYEASNWRRNYATDYDGFLVVFAADDDYTFSFALEIISEIRNCGEFIPMILVENKNDLILEGSAEQIEIDAEVRQRRLRMYSICGFDESHIVHPFAYLVERLTRNADSELSKSRYSDLRQIAEESEMGSNSGSHTSANGPLVVRIRDKSSCVLM